MPAEIWSRCGQPWAEGGDADGDENICADCREREFAFDASRSFGIYGGARARAIVLMRFERIEPLGVWFAKRLAEAVGRVPAPFAPDLIVPVRLHRTRPKERGFSQVGLFGEAARKEAWSVSVLLKRERARPRETSPSF